MSTFSRRAVLARLGMLLLVQPVAAQDTLKIVYPYAAGGSGDAVARMFAEHLQKTLARPVVVENKTGAGGRIGAQAVKDAPPDGSVLLFAAVGQMTSQPHLVTNLGYDPFADFAPISEVVRSDISLAVSSQIPVRSVPELVAWLKANPDQAVFGSPGAGTTAHFVGTEFARAFGLPLRHVAYRGTPAALPDLLAGRVPVYSAMGAELLEQHRAGTIRIIATGDAVRSPLLPDVPTLKESGIAIEAPAGFAFCAPARVPPQVAQRLENAVKQAAKAAEVGARIQALGFHPTGTGAGDLRRAQRAQFDHWAVAVKAAGYKAE
jgi:tripartite-type tricarboxylate transporter receptor subunit TctC